MNVAVYTCFLGSNDNWANVIANPIEGYDCYYFTNNPNTYDRLKDTTWKRVWLDIPMSSDEIECAAQSKHLRCCPFEYPELCKYQYLCWVDSKLRITDTTRFEEMVEYLKRSESTWVFTRHPLPYTDVWGEFHEAMKHVKYARQRDQARKYIESRLLTGYNEHIPQRVCCGFSIRKNCPLAKTIGDGWFSEIQECGIEDQISFQFVHQSYDGHIHIFPYQHCWSYV
jgi:hypothetical protein